MITTGTDIKALECLMFLRNIKSASCFEQMKGRGCRIIDSDELQLWFKLSHAWQEPKGVAIVRDNRIYVLITQEEWDARIQDVLNLLDPPANAARLLGKG
ncbi:hypothetical protein HCU40_00485 [Pseudanabaena biceps]|nr:hypothetical protein [Pseudanabaena biceps]